MNNPKKSLSVWSGNIQAGNQTRNYFDYFWRSWQHLHGPHKEPHIKKLAHSLTPYDLVGLQESDAQTFRSGKLHQTEHLAKEARFSHWIHQPNRTVGQWASSANGLLLKNSPLNTSQLSLPGQQIFGGRGLLTAKINWQGHNVTVGVTHLGLTVKARQKQLDAIHDLFEREDSVILMGDFNASLVNPQIQKFLKNGKWISNTSKVQTYPSWKPSKDIDHIFLKGWKFQDYSATRWGQSDHLAVRAKIFPD